MSIETIVFDGGPCSGKSTTLKAVSEQFGDQILVGQEVATVMFREFFPLPSTDPAEIEYFMNRVQLPILRTQESMEDILIKQAEAKMARMAAFDRAKPSNYAYWPYGRADFETRFGESLKKDFKRYDWVFFMETLAASDPAGYEHHKASNPSRYETADEAVARDKSLQVIWESHPNYMFIPSSLSMKEKTQKVLDFIASRLSTEIEVKYLIQDRPHITLLGGVEVEQGYLDVPIAGEVRLRRMGDRYYITIKGDGDDVRAECERSIDKSSFDLLWPATAGRRIKKLRYFIPHDGLTLELDLYKDELDGLITLECEFLNLSLKNSFTLPYWGSHGIDVTDNPKYKNKNLALYGLPV